MKLGFQPWEKHTICSTDRNHLKLAAIRQFAPSRNQTKPTNSIECRWNIQLLTANACGRHDYQCSVLFLPELIICHCKWVSDSLWKKWQWKCAIRKKLDEMWRRIHKSHQLLIYTIFWLPRLSLLLCSQKRRSCTTHSRFLICLFTITAFPICDTALPRTSELNPLSIYYSCTNICTVCSKTYHIARNRSAHKISELVTGYRF
jgi:hypothetical protein